jgi:hypothetical protein
LDFQRRKKRMAYSTNMFAGNLIYSFELVESPNGEAYLVITEEDLSKKDDEGNRLIISQE